MHLTIGHAALAAPRRLLARLVGGVFAIDLGKVGASVLRSSFFRHLARTGDELEHPLLGHGLASI